MSNSERVGLRALLRGAGVTVGGFLGASAGLAVGLISALLVAYSGITTGPFLMLELGVLVFPLLGGIVGAAVGNIMVGRALSGDLSRRRMMVIILIAASAIPAIAVADLLASGSTYEFPGILFLLPTQFGVPALGLGVIVVVVARLVGVLRGFRHRNPVGG